MGVLLADHEVEVDEETLCEVMVDLDIPCGKPWTQVFEEPYTPGRFKVKCCDECAEGLVLFRYRKVS